MRRGLLLVACSLGSSLLTGCVFPYCAYPKLDYTPAVRLAAPKDEVHAFRVDVDKPTADLGVFKEPVHERLTELSVTNTDEIPAQVKPSFTHGLVIIGVALNYLTHHSHTLALRVYRPGYELVEVKSWQRENRVVWKPAATLDAQEQALDSLFPPTRIDYGSDADTHRRALLFGASEYERLAKEAESADQRTRLTEKATTLHKRAE